MSTVVVMAKEPVAGRVKTRLCPPCSPRQAASLAAAALCDTLAAVERTPRTHRVLAFDGAADRWARPGWVVVPQAAGDLGARLEAAMAAVDGPVVVVGMDTPQITPALLARACSRLSMPDTDAVLGPAEDGGYWAIGVRRRCRGLFDAVEMSTARTREQQQARLRQLGLRVAELPELCDVDTFSDAVAVADLAPRSCFAQRLRATTVVA